MDQLLEREARSSCGAPHSRGPALVPLHRGFDRLALRAGVHWQGAPTLDMQRIFEEAQHRQRAPEPARTHRKLGEAGLARIGHQLRAESPEATLIAADPQLRHRRHSQHYVEDAETRTRRLARVDRAIGPEAGDRCGLTPRAR